MSCDAEGKEYSQEGLNKLKESCAESIAHYKRKMDEQDRPVLTMRRVDRKLYFHGKDTKSRPSDAVCFDVFRDGEYVGTFNPRFLQGKGYKGYNFVWVFSLSHASAPYDWSVTLNGPYKDNINRSMRKLAKVTNTKFRDT